jgi:hypothetical protein
MEDCAPAKYVNWKLMSTLFRAGLVPPRAPNAAMSGTLCAYMLIWAFRKAHTTNFDNNLERICCSETKI